MMGLEQPNYFRRELISNVSIKWRRIPFDEIKEGDICAAINFDSEGNLALAHFFRVTVAPHSDRGQFAIKGQELLMPMYAPYEEMKGPSFGLVDKSPARN